MPRLHVSPPRTKAQIAAQVRAQFQYARFSPQDYMSDWAFQRAVDQAPIITAKQFRELAKRREWSEAWLVEQCKAELDRPTQTIRWYLTQCPAETVLAHRCLTDLYVKAITALTTKGTKQCACGCGERVWGRQRFASQACQKRCYRRAS